MICPVNCKHWICKLPFLLQIIKCNYRKHPAIRYYTSCAKTGSSNGRNHCKKPLIWCYIDRLWPSSHQHYIRTYIVFIHALVLCMCICHSPSLSRISISGCLGSPMMTPAGPALTMSALKNSEFSGMPLSTIVTLKSSRLLPGWKVISKGPLGI